MLMKDKLLSPSSRVPGLQVLAFLATAIISTAAVADTASWTLEEVVDPSSYQPVAVLWQESATSISDEYGMKEVTPRLEFRCQPGGDGTIHVRIDWRRFISSFNTEVRFKADNSDAVTVTLGVDRSNKVTLTKSSDDDLAVLDYMDGHERLDVTVTPYSEVPVSVSFVIGELADGLRRLSNSCAN